MLITSQLPTSAWHQWLGEPTIADAIMDRLLHGSHTIALKGESLRRAKSLTAFQAGQPIAAKHALTTAAAVRRKRRRRRGQGYRAADRGSLKTPSAPGYPPGTKAPRG